jgi:hypothetical protein
MASCLFHHSIRELNLIPHIVLQRTFMFEVVVRKIQTITDWILDLVPNEEDRQILLSIIQLFCQTEKTHAFFMKNLKSMIDGSMPESLERAMESFPVHDRRSFVEGFGTRVDQVLWQLAVESAVEDNVSDLTRSGSGGGGRGPPDCRIWWQRPKPEPMERSLGPAEITHVSSLGPAEISHVSLCWPETRRFRRTFAFFACLEGPLSTGTDDPKIECRI